MLIQELFLDGAWTRGEGYFSVTNPFSGETLAQVANGSAKHAEVAVDAAVAALRSQFAAHRRAEVLAVTADVIESRERSFVDCIVAEAGKPVTAAQTEVRRALGTLRLAAAEASRLVGETIPMDANAGSEDLLAFTTPTPIGVVAAITPFNFPLNLVVHKVGPALAAGCPVVLKPSEKTPLTAGLLVQALADAGLPSGWVNLVTGQPEIVVDSWLDDDRVAAVTFTGSSSIGWAIKARSPRKKHILELGSNTALVVDASADVEAAVAATINGAFGYAGQTCISVQRVYVHTSQAKAFLDRLVAGVRALPVGDPRDERTVVGPLISRAAQERLLSWLEEARHYGADVLCGGEATDGGVLCPAVVTGAPPEARLNCEEAFGPIVSVSSFDDLGDALTLVNASRFGLNTAIFTNDLRRALRYAKEAEAGAVLVNVSPSFRADHMPYGGVKESGQGREGVKYAVAELLEPKLVVLRG